MYVTLQVKYRFSRQIVMKIEFSRRIFEKLSNIKFHKNPSSGSRVSSCGQTHGRTNGETDTTKLIVAFRKFSNVPNNTLTSKITHSVSSLVPVDYTAQPFNIMAETGLNFHPIMKKISVYKIRQITV